MPKHTIRRSDRKKSNKSVKTGLISTTRKLVACYCGQCNGKEVDPRTRKKHELKSGLSS